MNSIAQTRNKSDAVITQTVVDAINLAHITVDDLADRTGIPRSTIYSRLKKPMTFRLMELNAIDRVVKFNVESKEVLINGR